MIFVLVAQNIREFDALEQAVEFVTILKSRVDGKKCACKHRRLLISSRLGEPLSAFGDIATKFSKWLAKDEVTVLVSQASPSHLNPLINQGLESLLAMLILAFPEVRWLFATLKADAANPAANLAGFRDKHGLRNLFLPTHSALFDGTGLRDWIRGCAVDDPRTDSDSAYLARRKVLVVALDEETDYAHLHAYTAYRFGFRALAIAERNAADAVLGLHADCAWEVPPALVLEDIFLNFPDGGHGLSDLAERKKKFPRLEEAEHRVIVTSGQRVPGDAEKQARNTLYINGQRAAGKKVRLLHKPHAGLFSVWEESRLDRTLKWTDRSGKRHRGIAEGYVWPPDWRQIDEVWGNSDGSGHSSPGIFLLIARSLLKRAGKMLAEGVFSVEDAVRGAVLANDALELLGGKTPTTAAEALSLKHQFELHAECQFTGVEYHVPMSSRIKEIERDAKSIARWFSPQKKDSAFLNIQMMVVNHQVRILREYNQYDEEQICMSRVRRLHNSLWMKQRSYRNILWPLLRYLEWLLSSFAVFVTALAIWVIGLTLLFWATSYREWWPWGLSDAVSSFFSSGGPIDHPDMSPAASQRTEVPIWGKTAVACTAIVSGFLHLGVFISHLYSISSRK